MKNIRIGFSGLVSFSENKGCEALTFSFINVLDKLKIYDGKNVTIYFLQNLSFVSLKNFTFFKRQNKKILKDRFPNFKYKFIYFKKIKGKVRFFNHIPKLQCVFDFTEGDSFTDIYTDGRFDIFTTVKEKIINRGIPLIIGSQTIGPFNVKENETRAVQVLKSAYKVFTRDTQSFNYVKEISDVDISLTTDVAFFLPFKKENVIDSKLKIGFNPSGLLWNNAFDFGMSLNYKEFCINLVERLISAGYSVYLIGHVIYPNVGAIDNDTVAMNELHKMFTETYLAPFFKDPIDAKSYISSMDFFVGSRMHATIGALSSGVPVVPVSYSRKFEGLFGTLEYKFGINGRESNNDDAIEYILNSIKNIDDVKENVKYSLSKVEDLNNRFLEEYRMVLKNLLGE